MGVFGPAKNNTVPHNTQLGMCILCSQRTDGNSALGIPIGCPTASRVPPRPLRTPLLPRSLYWPAFVSNRLGVSAASFRQILGWIGWLGPQIPSGEFSDFRLVYSTHMSPCHAPILTMIRLGPPGMDELLPIVSKPRVLHPHESSLPRRNSPPGPLRTSSLNIHTPKSCPTHVLRIVSRVFDTPPSSYQVLLLPPFTT